MEEAFAMLATGIIIPGHAEGTARRTTSTIQAIIFQFRVSNNS